MKTLLMLLIKTIRAILPVFLDSFLNFAYEKMRKPQDVEFHGKDEKLNEKINKTIEEQIQKEGEK